MSTTVEKEDIEVVAAVPEVVACSETPDLDVTVNRKEYSIVGDGLYIPTRYEDAPSWLQSVIDTTVEVSIAAEKSDLTQVTESINTLIEELEVAKNTYTESIISSNDIDLRINTAINTLNSTLADADATILGIAETAVTPDAANALALDVLTAELANTAAGTLGATISTLQNAVVEGDSASAASIEILESALEGESTANATAFNTMRTYVGIDEAGASTGIGALADIEILQKQSDGVIETTTGTYDVMSGTGADNPGNLLLLSTYDVDGTTPILHTKWLAEESTTVGEEEWVRARHVGDVYIKYAEGAPKTYIAAYKFIKTTIDVSDDYSSTDADGYTWAIITDTDTQNAYMAALKAQDTADGKRRVFTDTPTAASKDTDGNWYNAGDIWVLLNDDDVIGGLAGDIYRAEYDNTSYEASDWVEATSYQAAVNASYAQTVLDIGTLNSTIQEQFDGKVETYYQDEYPYSNAAVATETRDSNAGDLWYCTNTHTAETVGYLAGTVYQYEETVVTGDTDTYTYEWVVTTEFSNALFDLADGKRTIYSNVSNDVPSGEANDIWIPKTGTDDETYVPEEIYQYTTEWVLATRYTEDLEVFAGEVNPKVATLENQVDGKIEYYYKTNEADEPLSTISTGWGEAENGNVVYYTEDETGYWYSSSTGFQLLEDTSMLKAAVVADGKITTYLGTASERDAKSLVMDYLDHGDIWITTDSEPLHQQYRWDGSSSPMEWVLISSGIVSLAESVTDLSAFITSEKNSRSIYRLVGTDYVYSYTDDVSKGNQHPDIDYTAIPSEFTGSHIPLYAEPVADIDGKVYGEADWIPTWTEYEGKIVLVDTTANTLGAYNSLAQSVTTTEEAIKTVLEYNTDTIIGGKLYSSGFGLNTAAYTGRGTPTDPYESEFLIRADKLRFTDSSNSATERSPFIVEGGETVFNGKVTFNGATGSVAEAVSAIVETTAVGDKNINITDNLIPTDSLVADIDNAGYQFIGDPVKSYAAGADTFAEAQVVIDTNDEVYSPYADDVLKSYYFRYAFKGNNTGVVTEIVDLTSAVNTPITYILDEGETINTTEWYIVDGLIHPTGGIVGASGTVKRASDMHKVASVNDIILDATTTEFSLGWVSSTIDVTVSRMKLAIITADTITSDLVNADYVTNYVSGVEEAINNNTTTIIGNTVTTGYVNALNVHANSVNAENITGTTITGKIINGGVVSGAAIDGGVISGAFIQDSTSFTEFTPYTGCEGFPLGLPYISVLPGIDLYEGGDYPAHLGNSTHQTGTSITSYDYCADTSPIRLRDSVVTAATPAPGFLLVNYYWGKYGTMQELDTIDGSSVVSVTYEGVTYIHTKADVLNNGTLSISTILGTNKTWSISHTVAPNTELKFSYSRSWWSLFGERSNNTFGAGIYKTDAIASVTLSATGLADICTTTSSIVWSDLPNDFTETTSYSAYFPALTQ